MKDILNWGELKRDGKDARDEEDLTFLNLFALALITSDN